jgi:phosphoribosylanthranilate isomerase
VAGLLERLQPRGLDASSGVEIAPGLKDMARVEALVAAVAAARRDSVAEQ